MSITLRAVLIIVSLGTAAMIFREIRRQALRIEDSVFWLLFSMMLVALSIFPQIAVFLSGLAGTQTPANFIYLAVIFLLLLKMFRMTIKLSKLETSIRDIAQEIALYKNRQEKTEAGDAVSAEGEEKYGKN